MKIEPKTPAIEQDSQTIGVIDVGEAHTLSANIEELLRKKLGTARLELSWTIELARWPTTYKQVPMGQSTTMMTSLVAVLLEGAGDHLLRAQQITGFTATAFQRKVIWYSQDSNQFRDLKTRWFSRN